MIKIALSDGSFYVCEQTNGVVSPPLAYLQAAFDAGSYEVIPDKAAITPQPNWDELYRRLLDGDLKPILESIQGASTQSLPVNTAFTQMIAVFQPTIRTEQALRDCLDALISFGFSVKSEHKILWNAAIPECEFSDLVKIN